jgi:hypothetical protein
MITQAFKILEFDSLRALVRRQARTEMGKPASTNSRQ